VLRRPALAAGVALAALPLVLFRDAVFRGRVFFERDVHQYWQAPARTFLACLRAGSWPLWDPYASFGQPFLANPA